jgi:hypothetical protein
MDMSLAVELIDQLIEGTTVEINGIKAQVADIIVMQVAVYAHDHIGADGLDFGVLSDSPSLSGEELAEFDKMKAVLLDREQRRNALKHLRHLLKEDNAAVMELLQQELRRFFSEDETYGFLFEPELEYPNEYVKSYPHD